MADIHGSPGSSPLMPQAGNAGSAPVPYQGPDQSPEPPDYGVSMAVGDGTMGIMDGIPSMPGLSESAAATSIAAGLADAPYYPGAISPIDAAGDNDAGGRDDVAATVAEAVSNATGRWHEFQSDTYGQGSVYGDLMTFPPSPLDPGTGVGNTMPTAGFYDPDRDYGGTQGAPGYQGDPQ